MAWDSEKTQVWSNVVQEYQNGKRKALALWSYPKWEISCSYVKLSSKEADQELQTVAGFFARMRGSFQSFLWLDDQDYQETQVQISTGDGTTKDFQLLRSLNGYFLEPIKYPKADTVKIYVDGVLTPHTLGDYGLVTLATAPAAATAIKADFTYYWHVAFDDDEQKYTNFWYNFYKLKKFELVTVK